MVERLRRVIPLMIALTLGTGCAPPGSPPQKPLPLARDRGAPEDLRGSHVGSGLSPGPRSPVPVVVGPPDVVRPGGAGRVAVVVSEDRARRVDVIDFATGKRVLPRPTPAWVGPSLPKVSADGRYVTYVGDGLLQRRLVVWDLAQGEEAALKGLEREDAEEPDVSGNGRYLTFLTGSNWDRRLAWYDRVAQAGGQVDLPEELRQNICGPSLSGTGTVAAYSASGNLGDRNVFLLDLQSGRPISPPTVNTADEETDPAVSPDGKVLLFSSNRNGSYDLFGYDLETGQYLDVGAFNSLGDETQPRFVGTEGRVITYVSTREGSPAVYWQTWNGGTK